MAMKTGQFNSNNGNVVETVKGLHVFAGTVPPETDEKKMLGAIHELQRY